MEIFEEVETLLPDPTRTIGATSFRYKGRVYTIITSDITSLQTIQKLHDRGAGYGGETGNYETMLFIDGESMDYPFGDLPGHPGLGVFQRYAIEDAARDGHQHFVTQVQRLLRPVEPLQVEYK